MNSEFCRGRRISDGQLVYGYDVEINGLHLIVPKESLQIIFTDALVAKFHQVSKDSVASPIGILDRNNEMIYSDDKIIYDGIIGKVHRDHYELSDQNHCVPAWCVGNMVIAVGQFNRCLEAEIVKPKEKK